MTATVTQLAARALRKLGIALIADASRPVTAPTATVADVVSDMLIQMGIPSPPLAGIGTVSVSDMARSALLRLDIPLPVAAAIGTVSVAEIAARALRTVGANPAAITAGIGTGTTWTVTQVATAALVRLAVVAPDDTPGAADQADALARATAVHDMLVATDMVTWASTLIPDAAVEFYVVMTAQLIAPGHGKPLSVEVFAGAQAMVRQLALSGAYGQALAEAKVAAVHEELNTLGIVSWLVSAIPAAYSECYVRMVGALLHPIYKAETPEEKTAGAAMYAASIAEVRRGVLISGAATTAAAKVNVVHEELNAQGLVTWLVSAVPTAYAEHYVMMAEILLRPIYKPDAPDGLAAYAALIAAVRRTTTLIGVVARATQQVVEIHAQLNDLGIVSWTSNEIPASVKDTYSVMAASKMTAEGGKPATPAEYADLIQAVRRVSMGGAAGQALAEQKVKAVHYLLESEGRVRWTLFDIPLAAEEPYVFMTAALLGPEVGEKVDPSWWEAADHSLSRIISLPSSGQRVTAEYF